MAPTSLTFIIHMLVVIIRKILTLFTARKKVLAEPVTCKEYIPAESASRMVRAYSVAVILLVGVYMSWLVVLFVGRAIEDNHANWKVAGAAIHSTKQVILKMHALAHVSVEDRAVNSGVKVTDGIYVPYRFFSDRASPNISFYSQNIHLASKK